MSFFEAIPGFYESEIVKHLEKGFPEDLAIKFRDACGGFLRRTWRSKSVDYQEKIRRIDISRIAIERITRNTRHKIIIRDILSILQKEMPQNVETGHTLAGWSENGDRGTREGVQLIEAGILVREPVRNDRWVTLAARAFDLREQDLLDNIALGGDNVLLAILIHVTRQYLRPGSHEWMVLKTLSELDIRGTIPRLRNEFCTLWNEIVEEARKQGHNSNHGQILKMIRRPFAAFHLGTNLTLQFYSLGNSLADFLNQF